MKKKIGILFLVIIVVVGDFTWDIKMQNMPVT